VAQAQENPVGEPEFLEFFGLSRHPFARLSEKSQIFDSEQYSLLMSHLAAATEATDCFVLVRGADGTGKTTLLNRFLNNLNENFIFATIDDSCSTDTEFYSAILKQLGFADITGSLTELRLITQAYLVQRTSAGDTVLLVIDNAHRLTAKVLQQLHWIAEQRFRGRRILSVVMAGNSDIAKIVDSPALAELKFRNNVDFHIRVFSEEETAKYVHFRLAESGNAEAVDFEDNCLPLVHRFTGGSRGSVNELCNAILAVAYKSQTRTISGGMIRAVASSHEFIPHVVPLNGMGRRRSDKIQEERIQERPAAPRKKRKLVPPDRDAELAQLRQSLAEAREALRRREQDIAEKDARIAALTAGNKSED
jgi:type II secretory pathway predicted ATPase ExeA